MGGYLATQYPLIVSKTIVSGNIGFRPWGW